jgi:hypothetical protein
MTKSPRSVARAALEIARDALPAYSCRTSRKDFTQHQLFAVLALKTFLKADYRGAGGRGARTAGGRWGGGDGVGWAGGGSA